jgi:hypothetical protein
MYYFQCLNFFHLTKPGRVRVIIIYHHVCDKKSCSILLIRFVYPLIVYTCRSPILTFFLL